MIYRGAAIFHEFIAFLLQPGNIERPALDIVVRDCGRLWPLISGHPYTTATIPNLPFLKGECGPPAKRGSRRMLMEIWGTVV
jgi:hypothetical protein